MARVKCFSCGKKRLCAWDCPEPTKVALYTETLKLYVWSHAFGVNSLP